MTRIVFGFFLFFTVLPNSGSAAMTLKGVRGDVQVLKPGAKDWIPAQEKMEVEVGDKLKTGEKSAVEIQIEKGTLSLGEKTQFGVKHYEVGKEEWVTASLELTLGRLKAQVKKMKKGSEFTVTTPTSVTAVRGTIFEEWVFEYLGEIFTRAWVTEGLIHFCNLGGTQCLDVKEGEHATSGEQEITGGSQKDQTDSIGDAFDSQPGLNQESQGNQDSLSQNSNQTQTSSGGGSSGGSSGGNSNSFSTG